jgi:hypothetical protein
MARAKITIAAELHKLRRAVAKAQSNSDSAEFFDAWRSVLRLYKRVNKNRAQPEPGDGETTYRELWKLAGEALLVLGGQAEPTLDTLDRYDHRRYGPMLGVSDEGSAAMAVRTGALASPKCAVLKKIMPLTVGVAHDAERLGAIGEVVVGPKEFATIRLGCMGRILTTTNVGTQVNLRNYQDPPVLRIGFQRGGVSLPSLIKQLAGMFEPFWKTPSGRSRTQKVLVQFHQRVQKASRLKLLKQLLAAVASGTFCSPKRHKLGLLVQLRSKPRVKQARDAIELARQCKLDAVAIAGATVPVPGEVRSLPGLLNHFEPAELAGLLGYGGARKVRLVTSQRLDPQTTARHVWQGLMVARNMGLELGKYGLAPLTFEEQHEVIARIQTWVHDWCAAPVCYIDYPIVTKDDVYHGDRLAKGVELWLRMVRKLGVRVVLIDTAKKSENRHLLKNDRRDERGILTLDQIRSLDAIAQELGVKTLWAGGISVAQAFEFGQLQVFGLYVTSAAASLRPLQGRSRLDPGLAAEREPDPKAVARVKLFIEAGFLLSALRKRDRSDEWRELAKAAEALKQTLADGQSADREKRQRERDLHRRTAAAWKIHFGAGKS